MVKPMEQIGASLIGAKKAELAPLPRLHVQFDHEIPVLPSLNIFPEYDFITEGVGHLKKPVMRHLGIAVRVELNREGVDDNDPRVFVRHIDVYREEKARYAAAALKAMIPEMQHLDHVLASGLYVSESYMNDAWTWLAVDGRAEYTIRDGFQTLPLEPVKL
jgi:hypothetical protein